MAVRAVLSESTMVAEIAIQQTINRYSEAASRAHWPIVVATFVPDAVWEIATSGRRFAGHHDILEGLTAFTAPFDYVIQMNAPAVIEVAGEKAVARSVMRERGRRTGMDQAFEALGFYVDALVLTPLGWLFERRSFHLTDMQHVALLPGRS